MLLAERESLSLNESHILLRGSSLRNTDWVYGIVIYTGHDTKVMMNSSKSRAKFSKNEIMINKYLLMSIFIQAAVCLLAAIYS